MRYRIHLPADRDVSIDDECESCKISIQMIYDGGYTWLGIGLAGGVNSGSPMIGGHAIVGQPGISDPATFYLGGKTPELVRRTELHVGESSIDFIGGRTVMDFTIAFGDWRGDENMGIRLNGPSSFIWAHGSDGETELKYHGPDNKSTFTITNLLDSQSNDADNSSSSSEKEGYNSQSMSRTTKSTKSAWIAHGIMAFLAFGLFVPSAISSALLRNCTLHPIFGPRLEDIRSKVLTKYWLHVHMVFNTTAAAFTVIVFSVAVSNTNREGSAHWDCAHSKMGLAMFILVLCQVFGGYFRPSAAAKAISGISSHMKVDDELAMNEDDGGEDRVDNNGINSKESNNNEEGEEEVQVFPSKSVARQSWELFHNILGLALFFFGVWQIYEGIELYHDRYGNANFTTVVIIYFMVMALWICIIGGAIVNKLFFMKPVAASGGGNEASNNSNVDVKLPDQQIESDEASEKASEII